MADQGSVQQDSWKKQRFMNILFIAPLPPPVTGQSLAVKVLVDHLSGKHQVEVIDLNKNSFRSGIISLARIRQIFGIFKDVWLQRRNKDIIYFTISESFAGNIKDLLIYSILFNMREKTVIHMLGGEGMKKIVTKRGWQYSLNKFFIGRLGGVIVEGQTQFSIFADLIPLEKIRIVPNFAEDYLFLGKNEIKDKFAGIFPLQILFLSNLIFGKGYKELVDGYLYLSEENKEKVRITFVGGFGSGHDKKEFLKTIAGRKGLHYHGPFAGGCEKKELYRQAHIFCLPTYYPYEGQPISILEAYATGCAVVTTDHGGIRDIFLDGVNGFEVQKMSPESIKLVIEEVVKNPAPLLPIAITNRETAYCKFRASMFSSSISGFMEKIACSGI
jgi:glycosyltransferase involved in cell wall biosynthesis